jgi:hypothetical protein
MVGEEREEMPLVRVRSFCGCESRGQDAKYSSSEALSTLDAGVAR